MTWLTRLIICIKAKPEQVHVIGAIQQYKKRNRQVMEMNG